MSKTKILTVIVVIVVILLAGGFFMKNDAPVTAQINNFEDCASAGYAVMETFPEQCRTPDGRTFTRSIATSERKSFGNPFDLISGQEVGLTDSLKVKLLEINDSRCKPDVVCIQEGEILAKVVITGASLGSSKIEFTIGDKKDYVSQEGYGFQMGNITPTILALNVTKEEISVNKTGSTEIRGYVHIGPVCPAVQVGQEEECRDKPHAVSIEIHYPSEKLLKTIQSGLDGRFLVTVPAGTWILRPQMAEVLPVCEEKRVVAVESKTSNVDIACDSGIR